MLVTHLPSPVPRGEALRAGQVDGPGQSKKGREDIRPFFTGHEDLPRHAVRKNIPTAGTPALPHLPKMEREKKQKGVLPK